MISRSWEQIPIERALARFLVGSVWSFCICGQLACAETNALTQATRASDQVAPPTAIWDEQISPIEVRDMTVPEALRLLRLRSQATGRSDVLSVFCASDRVANRRISLAISNATLRSVVDLISSMSETEVLKCGVTCVLLDRTMITRTAVFRIAITDQRTRLPITNATVRCELPPQMGEATFLAVSGDAHYYTMPVVAFVGRGYTEDGRRIESGEQLSRTTAMVEAPGYFRKGVIVAPERTSFETPNDVHVELEPREMRRSQ